MRPEPLRIEPIFSPRIWGAHSLAPLYPEKSNLAEPLGEAWLTGTHCKIVSGPFEGQTLEAAWRAMSAEWKGTQLVSAAIFPILVKFIFPKDQLSVQVHPDDDYAAARERAAGGRGKTEMWHAVSAEPDARVFIGLKPGVDKTRFLRAIEHHDLLDLFQAHAVHAGDTFFVPAGTPHTIGPGATLCEVQEYSDITYRIYDFGRLDTSGKPRELHLEKALDVIKFGDCGGGKIPRLALPANKIRKSLLAACRFFATERWEIATSCEVQMDSVRFDAAAVLTGNGVFDWSSGSSSYRAGECWLLPATLGSFSIQPHEPTTMIRTYVPDLPALRMQLKAQGHTEEALAKVVFD